MMELQDIITKRRELLQRETTYRVAVKRGEGMPADQKDRYIDYLADRLEDADLTRRAMESVMEDLVNEHDELKAKLEKLEKLAAEVGELKAANKKQARKISDLTAKLKFANKNRFGSKKQSVKKGEEPAADSAKESDRGNDEDNFDGTAASLPENSIAKKSAQPECEEPSKKKVRDLSNRPETYNTMGVADNVKEYKSDTSKVPGRILSRKMVKVFRLDMTLVEERFEMVQYVEKGQKPKWGYFPQEGNPQVVTKFDGTKATPEFLQAIAYEVYVKNVTFGLLHRWLTDMGMTISANTLHNWLAKGKKYLDRLVAVLKDVALEKDSVVNCDETWCKVKKYDHYKKCYIWVLVNKAEGVVIFFYEDGSRGRDVLKHFVGDAEIKALMSDGYNAYVFVGNELQKAECDTGIEKADHLVCMAHYRAKLVKAKDQAGDSGAVPYLDDVEWFYANEVHCNKEEFTPEERGKYRQSLEMKSRLITLRQRLLIDMAKDATEMTPYLREALNYLYKFWDNIFAYTKDGRYPIDNNAAERAVRPLTTQRNSMLHFGSDAGAEMAATYHSIISTVKLQGRSAWEYLGKFFQQIFNGCRDFSLLRPDRIGLAICQ